MKTSHAAGAAVVASLSLLAVVSGCGLLRVDGSVVTEPDAVATAGTPAAPVPERATDPRQAALYEGTARLTYKTVGARELRVGPLTEHYMDPVGQPVEARPACGPNPDPEWIVRWPSSSVMSYAPVAAWIESRIIRSYVPDLDVAYQTYRARWKTFDDTLEDQRSKANARASFYERMSALHAVFDEGMKAARELPAGQRVLPGALHTVVKSILDGYREAKVAWALGSSGTWASAHVATGKFAELRAWGDEASERRTFAALAMTGAFAALIPKLPVADYVHAPGEAGGDAVNAWLRWPADVDIAKAKAFFPKGDPDFAERRNSPKAAVKYPSETIVDLADETKEAILKKATPAEPALVVLRGLVVALEPGPAGMRVTLEQRSEYRRRECTEYGPVTHISEDGHVHRQFASCKVVEERDTHRRFIVEAKDWPQLVDLGDWVTLSGDLETVTTKGSVRSSSVEAKIRARFVGCFTKREALDPKAANYNETLSELSASSAEDCTLATW